MKKNNLIELVILSFLGIAVLISLFLPQLPNIVNNQKVIQLSIILRESDNYLWSNTRLGLEYACNELNAELRFLTLSTTDDSNEQIEIVKREIESGADAVLVVPADPMAFSEWVSSQKDICPIVCMESMVSGTELTISPDYDSIGKSLALAARHRWRGQTICLLDTSSARTGISACVDAAEKTLNEFNIPVKRIKLNDVQIKDNLKALLAEHNSSTLITFDPYSTELAAKYKENNSLDFKLYGTGVSAYITSCMERGTITAIAAWSDYAAGYLAAENAIMLARGKPVNFEPLPFKIIRGENMYVSENEKLLFPVIS